MGSRVLITGGAGYIGSQTAKALRLNGFVPVIPDNLCTGNSWAAADHAFFEADLANEDGTLEILRRYRIFTIIHFAAKAYIGESVRKARSLFGWHRQYSDIHYIVRTAWQWHAAGRSAAVKPLLAGAAGSVLTHG